MCAVIPFRQMFPDMLPAAFEERQDVERAYAESDG